MDSQTIETNCDNNLKYTQVIKHKIKSRIEV